MWTRNAASGYWASAEIQQTVQELPEPNQASLEQAVQAEPLSSQAEDADSNEAAAAASEGPATTDKALNQLLRRGLVLVEVEIPHVALMDGVHAKSFAGCHC